ncbi:MAG: CRISPR-associated protein Csd1 [Moorella sp. (in: firmicutes)]|nr:CRISPR-associated protein Csd1 [Moorella sp. (in: firmicutes)]
MLRALVEVAEHFREEGKFPPTGYKPKVPKWIVNLEKDGHHLEGPYTKKELRAFLAPDRQRSGTPSKTNLKPYLLFDDARYALGKAESGKEKEAELVHEGFLALLEEAYQETRLKELAQLLVFLKSPAVEQIREQVNPKDLVLFRVEGKDLAENKAIQFFWAKHLARELTAENKAQCAVCGQEGPVLRILPREVVVLGQKCQVVSFNKNAFTSFGKTQTENFPICPVCGSNVADALDYLTRTKRHHRTLIYDSKTGGLENQLAVFWLNEETEFSYEGQVYDAASLLSLLLDKVDTQIGPSAPSAELSQLNNLLSIPWIARESALNIDQSRFYLAVLSANKARLVVREWLEISIEKLKENLRVFLCRQKIVGPWGEEPQVFSIPIILDSLEDGDPNLTRSLLRMAYTGARPRVGILGAILNRFRNPKVLQNSRVLHPLMALLKLVLTYNNENNEEVETMEKLSTTYNEPAYLCGRLFAVLEEAQQRAANFKLNTTLVDRFYGMASTAPASVFGNLLRLSTLAHLPKVGREVNLMVEEILSRLDEVGGFPRTLNLSQQAEFALGFYHQRAYFRATKGKGKTNESDQDQGGETDEQQV